MSHETNRPVMGEKPYHAVHRAVLRGTGRVWHDLRLKVLYRNGAEFELMNRALGFAALAILTVIPLLIVVAAADPSPERGLAVWVIDGMGLTGSSADSVSLVFSAPGRVLGTTSVFGLLLVAVFGVSFAGSVQAGFEKIWGLPAGPWHKIWRQVVWLTVLTAYIFAEATVGTLTHGGLAATATVAVLPGLVFFWWGLRFLLGGRVSYLAAIPGAVATILGLGGLRVFSGLVFEPLVASNAVSYGALGTVLILQSWLIGVGWVIYGGQLFGYWFYDAWLQTWAHSRRGHADPGGRKECPDVPDNPSNPQLSRAHAAMRPAGGDEGEEEVVHDREHPLLRDGLVGHQHVVAHQVERHRQDGRGKGIEVDLAPLVRPGEDLL
jgi:membrane protein